jgi:four helix bundle protein
MVTDAEIEWAGTGHAAQAPVDTPLSFQQLEVWQRSMELVELVYACTAALPREEFDVRRQLRRSAIAVPASIAGGYRRHWRAAYQNHVSMALGSLAELQTELEIAFRTRLLERDPSRNLIELSDRVSAMLYRLHESLGHGAGVPTRPGQTRRPT